MKLAFDDPDLDGQLQRSVGKEPYGMANLGECLAIAAEVRTGSPDNWYDAFYGFAQTLHAEAELERDRGHTVSAREGFLRASEYYRNAYHYLLAHPRVPRVELAYQAHRACFHAAMPLLEHPLEAAEVPLEGLELSGYFGAVDTSGRPRPTLILPGGYDSTAEEAYATVAAGVAHGYNVFAFDGPGQGDALLRQRVPMRPDWETVLAAVIDALGSRSDVDASRLILLGRGLGSLLAARAAAGESRLAALVLDPGQHDLAEALRVRLPAELAPALDGQGDEALAERCQALLQDPYWHRLLAPRLVVHGSESVLDYLHQARAYTLRGRVERIACPTLVCENESGQLTSGQAEQLYEQLRCPKAFALFSAEQGAGGHCEGVGQPVFYTRMFDWLDDTLPP